MPKIIFLHVGDDIYTSIFAKSVKRVMPDAELIQCTDRSTPIIEGVDDVLRHSGDTSNLMTFRTECFSKITTSDTAIFLDTDMLLLQAINVEYLMGGFDIIACRRSFQRDTPVNTSFKGMDLAEYADSTLDQAWPYLACFTAVKDCDYWMSCNEALTSQIPEKFKFWYGDQEAIKMVLRSGEYKYGVIPEHIVACLPDLHSNDMPKPLALHFKGDARKQMMHSIASQLGLTN